MNKQQLASLVRVNLRYVNPQMTDKLRKKGKKGKALTRSLINQSLLSGLVFLLIYGVIMFSVDYSKYPGLFTYYVALFALLGFAQGVSVIYNIFFESKDLPAYLPLPFRQLDIFLAKIAVVALTVVPYVFPIIVLNFLTAWRSQVNPVIAVIFALITFVLVTGIIFCLCTLMVFGLSRVKFFQVHKNALTMLMLSISMIVAVGGVLLLNMGDTSYSENGMTVHDRTPLAFLMPLYRVMRQPLSSPALINLALICLAFALLALIVRLVIVPKMYSQLLAVTTNDRPATRKHTNRTGLRQILFNYNFQLIKNPNLIMQVMSTSLLMPVVFIFTFGVTNQMKLNGLSLNFLGVLFVAGIALGLMMTNQASFIANIISLDQDNFLFIRSLPLSLQDYLKEKFRFGTLLQLALTTLVVLLAVLVLRIPLLLAIMMELGALLGTYMMCLVFFHRDYRLLLLSWTNIQQLFTRGGGSLGQMVMMFGLLFGSGIVIAIYAVFVWMLPALWYVNLAIGLIVFAACCLYAKVSANNLWRQIPSE